MLYTLFYSRLRSLSPELQAEYEDRSMELFDLATLNHPGFADIKTFVADDGERLTVVRFKDAESQRGWRLNPTHKEAQAKGRTDFYEAYRVVLCDEVRTHKWTAPS